MRLRGTTGSALEEIGEDTEGLIEDFSKLNNKVKDLTKTASNPEGVSIVDKMTGGYKSTYKILLDISKVWKEIGDMQKAELLENIAGKTRATAVAAILESPDILEQAYNAAKYESTDAGAKAIEASLDSIEKKSNIIKNNLKNFSQELFNSDGVKDLLDTVIDFTKKLDAKKFQPLVNTIESILSLLTKILSIVPPEGVLGAIIGAKFIQSTNPFKGFINFFTKLKGSSVVVDQVTDSTENLGKEMVKTSAKATILKSAMGALAGVLISLAVNWIKSVVERQKELRKEYIESLNTMKDITKELKERQDSLEDITNKYIEYNKELNTANITEAKALEIRDNLITLQEQLNEKYGNTVSQLDLVNGRYETQLDLLAKIKEQDAQEYLRNNQGQYITDLANATQTKTFGEWSPFNTDAESPGHTYHMEQMMKAAGIDPENLYTVDEFYDAVQDFLEYYRDEAHKPTEQYQQDILDMFRKKWSEAIGDEESDINVFRSASENVQEYEAIAALADETYNEQYKKWTDALRELKQAYGQNDFEAFQKAWEDANIDYDYSGANSAVKNAFDSIKNQMLDVQTDMTTQLEEQQNWLNTIKGRIRERAYGLVKSNFKYYDSAAKVSDGSHWQYQEEDFGKLFDNLNIMSDADLEVFEKYVIKRVTDESGKSKYYDSLYNIIDNLTTNLSIKDTDRLESNLARLSELEHDANSSKYNELLEQLKVYKESTDEATIGGFVQYLKDIQRQSTMSVQELIEQFNINDWDLTEKIDLSEWFKQQTTYGEGKDATTYDNNALIDAWESSVNQFTEYLKNDREGQIEVDFGKLINVVSKDELFETLGMDTLSSYIKRFGDESVASFAYVMDAEKKLVDSLDLSSLDDEGYQQLLETLNEIRTNALGGSDSVFKIEDSYNELLGVLEQVEKETKFDKKYMEELITTYPTLKEAVIKYTDETYGIQSDAIKSLIGDYGSLSNEAISYLRHIQEEMINVTLETLDLGLSLEAIGRYLDASLSTAERNYLEGSGQLGAFRELLKSDPNFANQIEEWIKVKNLKLKDVQKYNGGGSGKKDDDDDDKKDNKSRYDWLDSYLDKRNREVQKLESEYERLQYAITKTGNIEDQYYSNSIANLKEQDKALKAQEQAYARAETRYEKRMRSGLLWNDLVSAFGGSTEKAEAIVKKIENRESVNLKEYTSEQQAAISSMMDNYNKELDAHEKQLEIQAARAEKRIERFKLKVEQITTAYDKVLAEFNSRQTQLEHYQTMRSNAGIMENQKLYLALLDNETRKLESNIEERDILMKQLDKFNVQSEDGLKAWEETRDQIEETTKAIYENEEAIESLKMSMQQLAWDLNDRVRDITGNIRNETSFLIDTLGTFEKDMYSYSRKRLGNDVGKTKIYNGEMSEEGLATLALRRTSAKSYRETIEELNKEIAEVEALYLSNTASTTYLDRLNTLRSERQSLITSYNQEREAILDLVKDGYDKQLESLQAITDKTMDMLNAQKASYEFSKNMAKQTKNIATLRKQMMAYSSGLDDSEEARAKLQTLKVQLEEAEESYNDTMYDKRMDDLQKLFDNLNASFEEVFARRLENPEKILKSTEQLVNDNMPEIKETLKNSLAFYGTDISDSLDNILGTEGIGSITSNIAIVDGDIKGLTSSVNDDFEALKKYYRDRDIKENTKEGLYARAEVLYGTADGSFKDYFTKFNDKLADINENIDKADIKAGLSGSTGGANSVMTGAIVRATDNALLKPLSSGNSAISTLSATSTPDPFSSLKKNNGVMAAPTNSTVTFNNSMSPTIVLNGVSNVSQLASELQKNKTFESMMQDMIFAPVTGGSSLSKLKYKF